MQKILVLLLHIDAQAERLIRFANQLAAKTQAEVVFLHCAPSRHLTPTALSGILHRLRSIAKNCQPPACKCGISGARNECLVRTGSIKEVVQEVLAEYAPDLLLLQAPEILDEDQRLVQEEVSFLLNQVRTPVLVVPQEVVFRPFQTLVFATDYTDFDQKVLEKLQAWADLFGAQTHIVQFFERSERLRLLPLKRAMNKINKGNLHPNLFFHLVEEEDLLEGIGDFAERCEADLLVLATQDDHLLQQMYGKPYRKTQAYQTTIPVLRYYQQKAEPCSGTCTNCSSKMEVKAPLADSGIPGLYSPKSVSLNWEI